MLACPARPKGKIAGLLFRVDRALFSAHCVCAFPLHKCPLLSAPYARSRNEWFRVGCPARAFLKRCSVLTRTLSPPTKNKERPFSFNPHNPFRWVWVNIKPPGDRRFWSMCPPGFDNHSQIAFRRPATGPKKRSWNGHPNGRSLSKCVIEFRTNASAQSIKHSFFKKATASKVVGPTPRFSMFVVGKHFTFLFIVV